MKGVLAVVVVGFAAIGVARAQDVVLDEIVGSWQGDDELQYVELRMQTAEANMIGNRAAVLFDDATGSDGGRRAVILNQNLPRGGQGVKILLASAKIRDTLGAPDFLLPPDFLHAKAGRVCLAAITGDGFVPIDCVAYGEYTGDNAPFGAPTPRTPENRALQRVGFSGRNRPDWTSVLDPVLERNSGHTATLAATLCGDGTISQGEECDGDALGGATCATLGFAKGKLACVQCHYDTSECTACGNGAINGKEECDGGDLAERTCTSLGYTGGTLACSDACKVTTADCDPSFFVTGGGPPKTDCLGEWRVTNTAGGPNVKGKTAARQTCKDGDPGCDADATANGTCTFTVAPCFSRQDARLPKCGVAAVSAWTLLGKIDAADPSVIALVAAVGALGPSTSTGVGVTFAPALAVLDACPTGVEVPVPAGQKRVFKARTDGPSGKPKDTDVLRLACTR